MRKAVEKRIQKAGTRPDEVRDAAFQRVILSIPKGKVATYGAVAAAAGYPLITGRWRVCFAQTRQIDCRGSGWWVPVARLNYPLNLAPSSGFGCKWKE